jgi:hypothetical protein
MWTRRSFLAAAGLPAATSISWAGTPPFRFRSDFWVNLHHFVRAEARRRMQDAPRLLPELDDAVLRAYDRHARANLVFDQELIALKSALVEGAAPSQTLQSAAGVYRDKIWPAQDRENKAWIERMAPLALRHRNRFLKQLAKAFQAKWPAGPILIDVCPDSGPTLAYTTGRPKGTSGHVIIDPRRASEPAVAFEILFHEASHVVDDQLIAALNRASERLGRKPPEDLWHAVIFHTAGYFATQVRPTITPAPYARRFRLQEQYWASLDAHWQPWLEGKASFTSSLEGLISAVTSTLRVR